MEYEVRQRLSPQGQPFHPASLPTRPDIEPDVFSSVDLRAGKIMEVEPFLEARDPAYKLVVDLGVVLGLRRTSAKITNYPRDQLLGRTVVVATNLGKKRIAGFVSECLVLGALQPDGTVHLLDVDGAVEPGSVVA